MAKKRPVRVTIFGWTSIISGLIILLLFVLYIKFKSISWLEFKFVHKELCSNCSKVKLETTGEELFADNYPSLTIDDIYSAIITTPFNENTATLYDPRTKLNIELSLVFTEKGKAKLVKVTSENVGKRLGIFNNGRLSAAPEIIEPIAYGKMVIEGMAEQEVLSIAEHINKLRKQSTVKK